MSQVITLIISIIIYYSYYFRIIIDYEKDNKKRIALINNKYWKINDEIEKKYKKRILNY